MIMTPHREDSFCKCRTRNCSNVYFTGNALFYRSRPSIGYLSTKHSNFFAMNVPVIDNSGNVDVDMITSLEANWSLSVEDFQDEHFKKPFRMYFLGIKKSYSRYEQAALRLICQ